MPVSIVNGVKINWRAFGSRGPWVAMTTGGRRSHDEFVPLAKKISFYGYRVMLHDRRNTGASEVLIEGDESEEMIWCRDLHELMTQQNALPAFFCGSSSGARTSILFYLNYPSAVRALLLMRLTGGSFAANRLPENYYRRFIRAAQEGGMAKVCQLDQWQERIKANPKNGDYLSMLSVEQFIAVQTRWLSLFIEGANQPVMGVSEEELQSIKVPTIIIPGNDKVHSSKSGEIAHSLISSSVLHRLPIRDEDIPLIPFPEWAPYEDEIARAFADFMSHVSLPAQ